MVPGALRQRDGRIALTALAPLGELDSATLDSLAALAGEVRIGRAHTITVCDLSDADAQLLAQRLRHLGLVLDADSGWVGLSACVGVGRCARARLDVRRAAAERAARRSAGAPTEHWSACERRCGQPPDVGLAIFPGAPSTAAVAGGQP
jgi:sulfite reductase beta subunit-like hemoprotein